MQHLLDKFGDWCEDPRGNDAARRQAMTREAYDKFQIRRKPRGARKKGGA